MNFGDGFGVIWDCYKNKLDCREFYAGKNIKMYLDNNLLLVY